MKKKVKLEISKIISHLWLTERKKQVKTPIKSFKELQNIRIRTQKIDQLAIMYSLPSLNA
jgi:hypothetical protein